jgi:2-polyprenyl-6-methoxyphenol hydroxylase-like FAD-dependent oxidoreductase
MIQQKICIIGNGMAGLTTAVILSKQNISIDLYCGKKNKNNILDNRTTAISESNFQYIKNSLNLNKTHFFWTCKKISLFFEENKKIINFLNFDKNKKNFMYIFQNKDLKKQLDKIILKKNNINLIKKNIDDIYSSEGFVISAGKKKFYDLIILSTGGSSKFYSKIEAGRSITKNYEEVAITSIVSHNTKIENPSQFFLKEGPLAVLPFQKNKFSIVWSVSNNYFKINNHNLKKILSNKLKILLNIKKIKDIQNVQSFPIYLNLKTKYFKKNILILGDGLHTVHPIAGQGFNLVIRDIRQLAKLMSKISKLGLLFKDSLLLRDFYNTRKSENNLFGLGINLTNLFFKHNKYLSLVKNKIISNVKNFNFIKKTSQLIADKGILP